MDFSKKESIVGFKPINVVQLSILEARENFLLAYEQFSIIDSANIQPLIARLRVLFLKIMAVLQRTKPDYDYLYILDMVMYNPEIEIDDILSIYYIIEKALDKMELTKVDLKEREFHRIAELENMKLGL